MTEQPRGNTFDKIAVGAFSTIIVITSLSITFIITSAAATRYIFKINFVGYDEIAVLVAFWFYFTGAAYGAFNNSHVSADVVDAYFPEGAAKRTLAFARWLVTSIACGLFVYYGYRYFMFSFVGPLGNFQFLPKSMTWRIPLWTTHISIFLGLIFMEVYFIRNLAISAKALVAGRKRA
ncbi:MAG: TRAP transporter small permease subunit [Synergistaceae bacterium]|jgi:TRAP-type C4-dicarboxylate transport system permease small subunit|nr:TRAP transporter small permease subunit [Synergistaceae bacterium]